MRKILPFFLIGLFIALVITRAPEFAMHRQDQKNKKLKTAGLGGYQLQVCGSMSTEAADVVCYVDLAPNEIHLSPGHGWKECAQRESETLIRSGRP